MIQCPKCKADIPDDSWYCDQCGAQLLFCPKCGDGKPRRGKRCTQCGTLLVPGTDLGKQSNAKTEQPTPQQPSQQPSQQQPSQQQQQQTQQQPQKEQKFMTEDDIFSAFNVIFKDKPFASQQPQNGGTQRSQPANSGTMRGPSTQQGGTQRASSGLQMQPDAPQILRMVDNPQKVVVLKPNAIIGRTMGDYLDVFSSCSYVSSQHGKIVLNKDGNWLYTDLGSTNGTKIYTTQLTPNKYYVLKKGMTIEIGFVKFKAE